MVIRWQPLWNLLALLVPAVVAGIVARPVFRHEQVTVTVLCVAAVQVAVRVSDRGDRYARMSAPTRQVLGYFRGPAMRYAMMFFIVAWLAAHSGAARALR